MELPPPSSKETIETYRIPEESLYRKPLPILKDVEELDVFTRHIPKQIDIDKFLQILKAKVTKSYDLSVTASELVKEYPNSPVFSNIYNYITQNVLPKDKRSQRMVIANAENYIVANGILFRIIHQKKIPETPAKCLLVFQKNLKIPSFTCFMILYSVHIMALLTHIIPSKIVIGYIICLKSYKGIFLHVKRVNNKNRKEVRLLLHPRIPLSYNPMSYISADIKYMPKGIYDYEFLLIAVCEITGFVIAIPLIKHDAVSIAHALIARIFLFLALQNH